MGVASEPPQRRDNKISPRMNREPTWYFQSKLLVSYARKDNMRRATRQ